MKMRFASFDDADLLWNWRNDADTRANSVNTAEVPWSAHCTWLKATLSNPNRDLLVAEVDGTPVGTVRIDRGEETEISWTVAPNQRGKGIGKQMIEIACPRETTVARIKAANKASQRIAETAGFRLIEDGDMQLWKR